MRIVSEIFLLYLVAFIIQFKGAKKRNLITVVNE